MGRDTNAQLAQQDEARKDQFTGMINQQVNAIPSDYTDKQKADITSAELGGIDVGYGNLRDQLLSKAAATGSESGIPETLVDANRQAIQEKAAAGEQLQETFANVPVQRALQKASVFQPALSGMLYDRYPSQPSNTTSSIIGAAGQAGATALMVF
jgi:hypothetical protein